jgi:hypothetical protein
MVKNVYNHKHQLLNLHLSQNLSYKVLAHLQTMQIFHHIMVNHTQDILFHQ